MVANRFTRAPAIVAALALLGAVLATAAPAAAQSAPGPIAPTHYVKISDGTLIAVNVRMPKGFVKGRRYPTIFEMSGYESGSAPREGDKTLLGQVADETGLPLPVQRGSRQLTRMFESNYVTVHASVRGTGCSSGEFDLFSWRSALDGREVMQWIAGQPWSNGKVGIMGHSYGGITGFMIAATRPPSLVSVTVSGLIDDLYRGITYPGGVTNYGFPLLWTGAIRPAYDVLGGTGQALVTAQDEQCARNLATHRRTVLNDPIVQGISETDNEWFRARSLTTYAHRINVPVHITGTYQDEQTGPRGPAHLWEMLRGMPKRLVLTNGDHGTNMDPGEVWRDRRRWMDHWMRGKQHGFGTLRQDKTSVVTLFEMHPTDKGLRSNGRKVNRTFPLEDTRWTSYHLRQGGKLTRGAPHGEEPGDTYVSGSPRQSWSYQAGPTAGSELTTPEGPDELAYRSAPVKGNRAIAGPIVARLFMSSTAPETEIFVQLIDEGPDGSKTYLQRGMLRASHRAITPGLSDWVWTGKTWMLYRPYRPHTNPTEITPGRVYEFLVEVFPVGHVFRPGHRIVVKIHTPPAVDSYYAYIPKRAPALNTVLHGKTTPSRIVLPIVPLKGVKLGPELACGQQDAVRCVP